MSSSLSLIMVLIFCVGIKSMAKPSDGSPVAPVVDAILDKQTRCETNRKIIEKRLVDVVQEKYRSQGRSAEPVISDDDLRFGGIIDWAGGGQSRDILMDSFVRFEPGFRMLLPKFSLGVQLSQQHVGYVCLDLNESPKESQVRLSFVNLNNIDRFWAASFAQKFRKSYMALGTLLSFGYVKDRVFARNNFPSVQFRPFDGSLSLIEEVLHWMFPKYNGWLLNKFYEKTFGRLHSTFASVAGLDVSDVILTKEELRIYSVVSAGKQNLLRKEYKVPLDPFFTDWMNEIPADADVADPQRP